jgi:hypothetical protein
LSFGGHEPSHQLKGINLVMNVDERNEPTISSWHQIQYFRIGLWVFFEEISPVDEAYARSALEKGEHFISEEDSLCFLTSHTHSSHQKKIHLLNILCATGLAKNFERQSGLSKACLKSTHLANISKK